MGCCRAIPTEAPGTPAGRPQGRAPAGRAAQALKQRDERRQTLGTAEAGHRVQHERRRPELISDRPAHSRRRLLGDRLPFDRSANGWPPGENSWWLSPDSSNTARRRRQPDGLRHPGQARRVGLATRGRHTRSINWLGHVAPHLPGQCAVTVVREAAEDSGPCARSRPSRAEHRRLALPLARLLPGIAGELHRGLATGPSDLLKAPRWFRQDRLEPPDDP